MQTLKKILEGSEALFGRYGIKSVTMDDVAKELGISKKTLYQYVSDKNDLVEKVLDFHLQHCEHTCELLAEEQTNPIEAMLAIGDFFYQHTKDTSPSLLFDLRKYHPSALQKLNEYRSKTVVAQLKRNLTQGIDENLYRDDINIDIIPGLYIGMVDGILESNFFPRDTFKFEEVIHQMLRYHIHGIATSKGIKHLNKLSKNN